MTPGARASAAALVILLLFVGVFSQGESWEFTETSHGAIPGGHGALYRLLVALELTAGRSYAGAEQLPGDATLWWIEPEGLCRDVGAAGREPASGVWRALDWIEAGGTGVLFLPSTRLPCLSEIHLDGQPLPLRALDGMSAEEREERDFENSTARLRGPSLRAGRNIEVAPGLAFESAPGFERLVETEAGGAFAISRRLGAGQLVVVASARFLENQSLDRADAAPLAVDLALALGRPWLDEREHGLLPTPSPLPYLAASAAMPAFALAALLAGIALWRARADVPPTLDAGEVEPPSLEAFVASIATLYAGTRDYTAVLESYQEFALNQLRRHFLVPPDTPPREICRRLRSAQGLREAALAPLLDTPVCGGRADLLAGIEALDAILLEAAG